MKVGQMRQKDFLTMTFLFFVLNYRISIFWFQLLFKSVLSCIIKTGWLQPSFGGTIYYLFVQNVAVNWVNAGCKLSSCSSDFFKFDIVCCQALLQVKANLCKCNNLSGYILHRYQKPRARTNEVSSTERKNSICLARSFDINFRCKHYVLTCILFAWIKSCFVKMSMQITGCY